jgi:hypothetical protein
VLPAVGVLSRAGVPSGNCAPASCAAFPAEPSDCTGTASSGRARTSSKLSLFHRRSPPTRTLGRATSHVHAPLAKANSASERVLVAPPDASDRAGATSSLLWLSCWGGTVVLFSPSKYCFVKAIKPSTDSPTYIGCQQKPRTSTRDHLRYITWAQVSERRFDSPCEPAKASSGSKNSTTPSSPSFMMNS